MDAAISGLDRPVLQVDFDLVELFDLLGYSRHLQCGQADREAVTIEDSGEALRNHGDYVRIFDSDRRLLATGAASKILTRYEEISWPYFLVELRVEPVHAILSHLHRVVGPGLESERNDDVGVHIIWPDPRPAPQNCGTGHRYLLGSAIFPSIADAAAVAGDDR